MNATMISRSRKKKGNRRKGKESFTVFLFRERLRYGIDPRWVNSDPLFEARIKGSMRRYNS